VKPKNAAKKRTLRGREFKRQDEESDMLKGGRKKRWREKLERAPKAVYQVTAREQLQTKRENVSINGTGKTWVPKKSLTWKRKLLHQICHPRRKRDGTHKETCPR